MNDNQKGDGCLIVACLPMGHIDDFMSNTKPLLRCVSHSVVFDSLLPHRCNPPGSSVHEILQAGMLEWVAIS